MPSRCGAARNGPCRVGFAPLRRAGAARFVIPSGRPPHAAAPLRSPFAVRARPRKTSPLRVLSQKRKAWFSTRSDGAAKRRSTGRGFRRQSQSAVSTAAARTFPSMQRREGEGGALEVCPRKFATRPSRAQCGDSTAGPARTAIKRRAQVGVGRSREGGRHGVRLDGRRPAPARSSIRWWRRRGRTRRREAVSCHAMNSRCAEGGTGRQGACARARSGRTRAQGRCQRQPAGRCRGARTRRPSGERGRKKMSSIASGPSWERDAVLRERSRPSRRDARLPARCRANSTCA